MKVQELIDMLEQIPDKENSDIIVSVEELHSCYAGDEMKIAKGWNKGAYELRVLFSNFVSKRREERRADERIDEWFKESE